MNDRRRFESRSDDYFSSQQAPFHRMLRFAPGSDDAGDGLAAALPLTDLPGVDIPHRLRLPEGFEPEYAYPLLIWLHDEGGDVDEIDEILPRISERNYIAAALQGNMLRSVGRGWSTADDRLQHIQRDLQKLVFGVDEFCRIHWDRIYLAGFGAGGTLAWELLLREPNRWAGAICLSGQFPRMDHPLASFRELHLQRLLLSTGLDCSPRRVADLVNSGRLMYSAGLEVGTRMYETGCRAPTDKMLRDVDRWMMDSIATAIRS